MSIHPPYIPAKNLKDPEMVLQMKSPIQDGVKFIKHIYSEGYQFGYLSEILDEYFSKGGRWKFYRRIRIYQKPFHVASIGDNTACKRCADFYKEIPEAPEDEVIICLS